jgi:hypothetical protein
VDPDEEFFIAAIDDVIHERQWDSPVRWAPVIERLHRLADEWRTDIARREGSAAAPERPDRDGPGR